MGDVNAKQMMILHGLEDNPMTASEFAEVQMDDHVLNWAPEFTHLKDKHGLIERTGEKRRTSRGGQAHVHRLTEAGKRWVAEH